jgi:hypothetical protein
MDAYDRFWQWAEKPPESLLTIPAVHHAVMTLPPVTAEIARRSTPL